MKDILEKISDDTVTQTKNSPLTDDVNSIIDEYADNQFKMVFKLADVRERKSAVKDIIDDIEETNIVIDGDIWTPEVQIYEISNNKCNMKISVKNSSLK